MVIIIVMGKWDLPSGVWDIPTLSGGLVHWEHHQTKWSFRQAI